MSSGRRTYVESTIIMTTVRIVAPFVMTFGLFVTFHGADSPGGGFQGGVIVTAVIVMLSFAFGVDVTRRWLSTVAVVALVAGGIGVFVLVGLGAMVLGGTFLEYARYPIAHASKYGIELVEVAIAMLVTGTLTGLFFALAESATDQAPAGGEE